jgi:hypothetical protein
MLKSRYYEDTAKAFTANVHQVKCVNDVTYFQGYVTHFDIGGSTFVKWNFIHFKKKEYEQNRG